MDYYEAAEYIMNIPRFGVNADGRNKSGNPNLSYVMEKLGNPHLSCRSIHVAGTNGKGSTVQFIKNILCAKGRKVGCFISPHLIKINERISVSEPVLEKNEQKITSRDISDEDFLECFIKVKRAVDDAVQEGGLYLSFFEFVFAMAAVYFENKAVDYAVYETGLGGRLDATNILSPVITAITSIGLEHTKYLGDTVRQIAGEKAGIIKQGIPVIYNTGDIEADEVIKETAELMSAEAINVAKSEYIINDFTDKTIDFSLYNSYYKYDNIILNAGGAAYQADNAATAITLCNRLFAGEGYIDREMLQFALLQFEWPGRMERLHSNIVLDGAHNVDAILRFIESVKMGFDDRNIKLLFAVSGDKDYEPMIELLCRELMISEVYVTSLDSDRGISAEYIAALFRHYLSRQSEPAKYKVVSDDNIRNTFMMGFESARASGDILFCVGSLYLIGSIKEIAMEVLDND